MKEGDKVGEKLNIDSNAAKGIALAGALNEGLDKDESTIVLRIVNHLAPDVTMTGYWDGQLLKAAMRAIEKQYDKVRKHAAVWAIKQSQQAGHVDHKADTGTGRPSDH